jgi:hypothetical protein
MSECIIHLEKPFIIIIIFSYFNVTSRGLDYMAGIIINKQWNGKTVEVQYT